VKFAGQPLDIASGSHFDQFEQRPVALLVNHHKYIAIVSVAIFHNSDRTKDGDRETIG